MARDEIEGRKKRGNFDGPTGETMTRERVRDGESADGRAGGTGERVPPNEDYPSYHIGIEGNEIRYGALVHI